MQFSSSLNATSHNLILTTQNNESRAVKILNKISGLFKVKEEPPPPEIPAKYDRAFHFCDIYLEFSIKFMFINSGIKTLDMMKRNSIMTSDSLDCLQKELKIYGDELHQLIVTYSQDEALKMVRQIAKSNNRTLSPAEEKRLVENATEDVLKLRLHNAN